MSKPDECEEYSGIERRKYCGMVISVNQKFDDFIERYERDSAATKEYRDGVNKALGDVSVSMVSLRDELKETRRPYKILMWVVTIASGAFLLEISQWLFHLLKIRMSNT
jgi:hypothetical protein